MAKGRKSKSKAQSSDNAIPAMLTGDIVLGRIIATNAAFVCHRTKDDDSEIEIRLRGSDKDLKSRITVHNQRVSDIMFFSEGVDCLASASINGRFNVSTIKLNRGGSSITVSSTITLEMMDDCERRHPRVCWIVDKPEILIVGWGRRIYKLNIEELLEEEKKVAKKTKIRNPLMCPVASLIPGVALVGEHESDVTDISFCARLNVLISASLDGKVRFWDVHKKLLLSELNASDGGPLAAASLLSPPNKQTHMILATRGLLYQEVRFWASQDDQKWYSRGNTPSLVSSFMTQHTYERPYTQMVTIPELGAIMVFREECNCHTITAYHFEPGSDPVSEIYIVYGVIAQFHPPTIRLFSFTASSRNNIIETHTLSNFHDKGFYFQHEGLPLTNRTFLKLPFPEVVYRKVEESSSQLHSIQKMLSELQTSRDLITQDVDAQLTAILKEKGYKADSEKRIAALVKANMDKALGPDCEKLMDFFKGQNEKMMLLFEHLESMSHVEEDAESIIGRQIKQVLASSISRLVSAVISGAQKTILQGAEGANLQEELEKSVKESFEEVSAPAKFGMPGPSQQ